MLLTHIPTIVCFIIGIILTCICLKESCGEILRIIESILFGAYFIALGFYFLYI